MVLEDVDSDNEGHQKHENQSKASQKQETSRSTQSISLPVASVQSRKSGDTSQKSERSETVTKMPQEDAETQTGRWTPFIQSIKKEAEDVALATMEER